MKMRVITITEKNIKNVYARIRKFFYNNNRTGFESWHNFDCGFKKRINRNIHLYGEKYGEKMTISYMYPSPEEIKLDGQYIHIYYVAGESTTLKIGDKIAFLGNRITFREKWMYGHMRYIYTVFQATPMSKETQENLRRKARYLN